MRRARWMGLALLGAALLAGLYVLGIELRLYGRKLGPGTPTEAVVPEAVREARAAAQRAGADAAGAAPGPGRILFGDLHVHTTYSMDAFVTSLPLLGGEGVHPVSDACDFARFCSGLDFWSVNDHAESLTPRTWRETKRAIRQCNAVAGEGEPDVMALLGWEWSQVGRTPETHYGHKNVVLRDLAEEAVPRRPVAAAGAAEASLRRGPEIPTLLPLLDLPERQRYYDYMELLAEARGLPDCPEGVPAPELPPDCFESAATPEALFRKLDEWGFPALVIPHGTAWGFYTPPGTTWENQIAGARRGDARQRLVELYSEHGSSEEYRPWRAVREEEGEPVCPEPSEGYLPNCWRAGEIVERRCLDAGEPEAECARRAAAARRNHVRAGVAGHLTVKGENAADWLDAGQCRDCFLPAFDYRPGGSVQYALALSAPGGAEGAGGPGRFRFGFIGSSDDHKARPGTGYEEFKERGDAAAGESAEERGWLQRFVQPREEPLPRSVPVPEERLEEGSIRLLHHARVSSFMLTGGLAAVHARERSREALWEALEARRVYATSGERILLWFHLLGERAGDGAPTGGVPMGGHARRAGEPRFEVRALGAFEPREGCPEHAVRALGEEGVERLCAGRCHHPGDRRRRITRIEVVRIRRQASPEEPAGALVEDPWRVLPCEREPGEGAGCAARFADPEFAEAGRDALYYVRAIQEPTPVARADPLRCERDAEGRCVEARPCEGDCLAPAEERAWSSPIYLEHRDLEHRDLEHRDLEHREVGELGGGARGGAASAAGAAPAPRRGGAPGRGEPES